MAELSAPSLVAVIDDDEDVRISLEMLIGSVGHEAVLFASAEALLSCDRLDSFACFVSDVQMSGLDGLQLARRLFEMNAAPVILITAFASEDVERRAREAGVRCVLSKPFDPNQLIAELDAILA